MSAFIGPRRRVLPLFLLVLFLLIAGFIWFGYLGLFDLGPIIQQVVGRVRGEQVDEDLEDPLLLDLSRLQKREEALALREQQLENGRLLLDEREAEVGRLEQEIESRDSQINERENSLNERLQQYENRRRVLIQNSRTLTNMDPRNAVQILEGYDDQLLIDVLRITDELAAEESRQSLVPFWLAQLPPQRAADIQRKMTIKPIE